MKKRILLILLFFWAGLEITCSAQTPTWLWAKNATTFNASSGVSGMGMDAQGNTYSLGYSRNGIQFGNRPVMPEGMFLIKHNRQGNLVWDLALKTKSYVPVAISTDSIGNSFVTGVFYDTLTIGSIQLINYGLNDVFLAKIDSTGAVTWAQRIGGILLPAHIPPSPMDSEDAVYGLGLDTTGNCYLTGVTVASDTSAAMFGSTPVPPPAPSPYPVRFSFLAKFNPSGQLQWVTKGQDNSFLPNVVAVSKQGQLFTAGYFNTTVTIGNTTFTSHGLPGYQDILLAAYNSNGNFKWAKRFGGNGNEYIDALVFNKAGDLIISGAFEDTVQFGNFTLIKQSVSYSKPAIYLAKLDTAGIVKWASQSGGLGFAGDTKLNLDAAGNSFVACTFSGNVQVGQQAFTSTGGNYDVLVSKWDANGAPLWAVSAQGVGMDFARGIAVDPLTSDCLVNGSFEGPLDFGNIPLSTGQNTNFFLARLGRNTVGLPESITPLRPHSVYPNPASQSFSIVFAKPGGSVTGKFCLYNSTGQLVRELSFLKTDQIEVRRKDLPAGIYFYKLQVENDFTRNGKIVFH